jgi:single-stranded-DNA-specific exonuclease
MFKQLLQWQIQSAVSLPESFVQAVKRHVPDLPGHYVAQLLWQRGFCDPHHLAGFLDPNCYLPTSPFAFGQEMHRAVERLQQARDRAEPVAIWGDFDADGITATAVLWEGLGQFFRQDQQLSYTIPNRLTASHGLSLAGIDALAAQGCRLIVTCDNGSTNLREINHAQSLGIDVIITDHHTLPVDRPPVVAMINPRFLPSDHPLVHLSGVAVAYKLVEALYQARPDIPQRPLVDLLDLVAIGLIADLVQLTGDCRYLAQRGIERLQQQSNPLMATRPGVARLLELCKRNGDRPTDISFGLGPRINAISRIYGDARFGVELLTSTDRDRANQLAEETELANTRRKALQKDVAQQVMVQLAQLDLATTSVIVLSNPQWSVGVLGLVAGQIAQQYGRPTILLSEEQSAGEAGIARGSARSVHQIDLYQLVKHQEHLLSSFGGHPFAAGLSLPIENLPLFTEAINRELRQQQAGAAVGAVLQVDLEVTVAELGQSLFRELRLLEPCGIGNPAPKLLIQNCWFTQVRNQNIKDWRGHKVRYIKTEFEISDDSDSGFPGVWWEHYKDDMPSGRCDAIAELDFNSYQRRYEIRLLALRPTGQDSLIPAIVSTDWILDWRMTPELEAPEATVPEATLLVTQCPSSWDELQVWFRRALQTQQKLAIAYPPPPTDSPAILWQQFIGIAKYLSRTGLTVTRLQLQEKLGVGDRVLQAGFRSLKLLGFQIASSEQGFHIQWHQPGSEVELSDASQPFAAAVQEEQFRRQYFYGISLETLRAIAQQTLAQRSSDGMAQTEARASSCSL